MYHGNATTRAFEPTARDFLRKFLQRLFDQALVGVSTRRNVGKKTLVRAHGVSRKLRGYRKRAGDEGTL